MAGKILILSHEGDAHLEYVTKHLEDEDTLLINPADILDGDTIDFEVINGQTSVYYKNEKLEGVKSVWVRRPTYLSVRQIPVKARHATYVRSAAERHLNMLYFSFPNARWLSNMTAIKDGDVKINQQRIAATLGFNVPETLFASSSLLARAFIDRHKICIAKTQTQLIPYKYKIYSKLVRDSDALDFSNINLDPYTFQQYIEPKAEWRVSVVGDHVFTAEVGVEETGVNKSSFRDWRISGHDKKFWAREIHPPQDFEQQCIQLVRGLDLNFGALDFIVDQDDKIWFLEINPNGQWAFVEHYTGQCIGKAIADMLIQGSTIS
jgi:hypothetical protein